MDINNKDELIKLYSFTFCVTGNCPREFGLKHSKEGCESDCIYCWRNALGDRISELSKESENERNQI